VNENNTTLIFGPPGTGKTTRLMDMVNSLLNDGINPADICFVAFTRKAANEARTRAIDRFKLNEDQIPWFRTLHSLAYRVLGVRRDEVMGYRDYINIANLLGLTITFKGATEDGMITGLSKGDRLLFTEMMARARQITLRELWEESPDEDLDWHELDRLGRTLAEYKKIHSKRDYTDMIYEFANLKTLDLPFRCLIVDEAQDLTPIQWRMVERLASQAQEIFVAGDDDQAIFRWAGADIEHFQTLAGQRVVLPQSFRVPSKVMAEAERVVQRIEHRVPKTWSPRAEEGDVIHTAGIDEIDMSAGTWLLLARNVYLLESYKEHCMREGLIFDAHGGSPVRGAAMAGIRTWESLRKGRSELARDCKKLYELMSSRERVAYGAKSRLDKVPDTQLLDFKALRAQYGLETDEIWHKALDKLTPEEVEYFIAALRRGEKLLKEPRIKINTIHGVKGGEADNVVIQLDMAQRTFDEYQKSPDDEHRVWYVAMTRARERLYIMQPQTNRCYDI
jgi:DNA helicase II / ATP-dependent DNA helicase PcrA